MGLLSWLKSFFGPKLDAPQPVADEDRPKDWARKIDCKSIQNAFWVDDGVLMRSAQPTPAGFVEAREMGIKTIINLRVTSGDKDEVQYPVEDEDLPLSRAFSDVQAAGLRLIHVVFHPLFPMETQVAEVLRHVVDKGNQPVLIHCRHGSDRTGTMCAAYRIVIQGWDKEKAIQEMTDGGFGFHYKYFKNLVNFLKSMYVERVRNQI